MKETEENYQYNSTFSGQEVLTVIKIGGNIIDNSENLHQFLKDFTSLKGYKILVHGGGKVATKISDDMGIEAKLIDGRRITDVDTLRVVTMVYAGLINKNIVAQLQAVKCNAIGLTGADGNMIRTNKRPVVKASPTGKVSPPIGKDLEGAGASQAASIDYGFVGDIFEESVNIKNLQSLLGTGFIPVFSAITHNGNGQLLNTNADTVASAIAVALSSVYETSLVYCFEKKGVLRDVTDETSVIREIKLPDFEPLKEQRIISDGMLPKLHNAFEAIQKGVQNVYIGKADELPLLDKHSFGTRLIN